MIRNKLLGYADSDVDVALTDAIVVLNQNCVGCYGLHDLKKCVECPTERARQSLVVDATIQIFASQIKKPGGEQTC